MGAENESLECKLAKQGFASNGTVYSTDKLAKAIEELTEKHGYFINEIRIVKASAVRADLFDRESLYVIYTSIREPPKRTEFTIPQPRAYEYNPEDEGHFCGH